MKAVSKLAAYLFVAALFASLNVASFSAPAEKSDGKDLIRQVNTMAKVLETRLRDELGGDVVGPSIFQPGGVRGFVVPGVGAIFQINVNFPVVEPKPPVEKPIKSEDEDLWNRMERGEPAGSRVIRAIRRTSTAPHAEPVPQPPHMAPPGAPPAPAMPADPFLKPGMPPGAPPAQPEMPPAAPPGPGFPGPAGEVGFGRPGAGGFGGGGFGGGGFGGPGTGGFGDLFVHSPTPVPHGDVAKKIETLERVILETLAKYGERMTALEGDENIIVLVGGGRPGGVHVIQPPRPRYGASYGYSTRPPPATEPPPPEAKAAEEVREKVRDIEEELRDLQIKADKLAKDKKGKEQSRAMAATQREIAKLQAALPVQIYSYGPDIGFQGGSSWVLKVKKSDLSKDAGELRKRALIQKYAGVAEPPAYPGVSGDGSDDIVVEF